jgi:hypothetical protein
MHEVEKVQLNQLRNKLSACKLYKVGGTCSTHGTGEESVQGFGGKPEGKAPLERPGVGGSMGLEWFLGRLAVGVWSGFSWLRI